MNWPNSELGISDTTPGQSDGIFSNPYAFASDFVQSSVSVLHPEENGKGFVYWIDFTSEGDKNDPPVTSPTSDHVWIQNDLMLSSPVRITARIYYKKL